MGFGGEVAAARTSWALGRTMTGPSAGSARGGEGQRLHLRTNGGSSRRLWK